jgi:hypothetical protein
MKIVQSLITIKWTLRITVLVAFLAMGFFMVNACSDGDCGFDTINFTPVDDEAECQADAEANNCDDFEFEAPDQCTGFNCETCVVIDDDDILVGAGGN